MAKIIQSLNHIAIIANIMTVITFALKRKRLQVSQTPVKNLTEEMKLRKQSMMGGSRFEFNQNMDKRYEQRSDILTSAYSDVLAAIEQTVEMYVDNDLITRRSLEEWLGQKLVSEFIQRRSRQ